MAAAGYTAPEVTGAPGDAGHAATWAAAEMPGAGIEPALPYGKGI